MRRDQGRSLSSASVTPAPESKRSYFNEQNGVPFLERQSKKQQQEFGDEISIALHTSELWHDEIRETFKTDETAIYLLPWEKRKAVICHIFNKFRNAFGFYPVSVGSYLFDAATLRWMKSRFPSVKIAITNCFEEGINMFRGCNHTWYLFSEGGPWGAYYPSNENALCPAKNADDFCGIVGVSHLNRDMLLAITGRDDYFSSHPANILRGRGNDGDECPYNYRFIDQWIKQLEYNDFVYYNIYVGTGWMKPGSNFEEPTEYVEKFYREALDYLKTKKASGVVYDCTMTEFEKWFTSAIPIGTPDLNHWEDILCGSRRQIVWYADAYLRATIDPNMGGSITDVRPYAGRVNRDMGPESPNLHFGSYPYIVNSQQRGGFMGGSIHTYEVSYNGAGAELLNRRTRCAVQKNSEGKHWVATEPIEVKLGKATFTLVSKFTFRGHGVIEIERCVTDASDAQAELTITEMHRGNLGTTQYPEDMRRIELSLVGTQEGQIETIQCCYDNRYREIESCKEVIALIQQGGCSVSLAPAPGTAAAGS